MVSGKLSFFYPLDEEAMNSELGTQAPKKGEPDITFLHEKLHM